MFNKIRNPKRRQSKLSPTGDNAPDFIKKPRTDFSDADGRTGPCGPSRVLVLSTVNAANDVLGCQSQLFITGSPSSRPSSTGDDVESHRVRLDQSALITEANTTSKAQGPLDGSKNTNAPPEKKLKTRDSAWKGLEKAMRALHLTAETVPAVHSAVGGLVSCLDHFEVARKNREEYDEIASELSEMAEHLDRHLKDRRSIGLTEKISDIAKAIDNEISDVRKLQARSKMTQVLNASDREEDVTRRFRRVSELFRRIQMEISMSEWSNTSEILVSRRLEKLNPAMLALYDAGISDAIGRRACTEDTRQDTLAKIEAWCDDPSAPMIYWMNGMAGTGKTTIAYTIAKRLEARGQLGASFFCTVASEECRKASRIIPTISYQLSYQSTPFQVALVEIMKQPKMEIVTIAVQVERLLIEPLKSAKDKMAHNLVIIIDALDECHDNNVVRLLLDSFLSSAELLPLKFLITSRPEPMSYAMLAAASDDLRSVLHLHEVGEESVQRDIKLYLKEGLRAIQPSEAAVEQLAVLSGRLFIYAATTIRYIIPTTAAVDSSARLKTMLNIASKSPKKHSGIDALYSAILSKAVDNDDLEPDERGNILAVVWAVVSSNHLVSLTELGVIAGLGGDNASLAAIAPLRSVLHVSNTNDTISTFHASFSQFIFDQSRSGDFFCDPSVIMQRNVLQCFKVINTQLLDKIQHNTDISSYLRYASLNWFAYLEYRSDPGSDEFYDELRDFLENRFEKWVGLVDICGCSMVCLQAMVMLEGWLRQAGTPEDLSRATVNAQVFLRSSGADRKLIRDEAMRGHREVTTNSTHARFNRSWIWGTIGTATLLRALCNHMRQS